MSQPTTHKIVFILIYLTIVFYYFNLLEVHLGVLTHGVIPLLPNLALKWKNDHLLICLKGPYIYHTSYYIIFLYPFGYRLINLF